MLKPNDLSENTLGALFDQSTDCVKLLDPDGRVVWMNSNGQKVMEIGEFCAIEGSLRADFWPEERRHLVVAALADGPDGSTHRFRAPCPTLMGTEKWWEVTVSPVVSRDDGHAGFLAISRDITAEHDARAALDLALIEMRQRLSNVFAIATNLVRAQTPQSEGAAEYAANMAARLETLSAVQTMFGGQTQNVRIGKILSTILAPFRITHCEVEIGSVEDRVLTGLAGDSIALVLGELCLHAARNGAFDRGGAIRLRTEAEGGLLTLFWNETLEARTTSRDWFDISGIKLVARILAARGDVLTFEIGRDTLSAELSLRLT